MAPIPPNPFAWQSNANKKYLTLDGTFGSQGWLLEFTDEVPKYFFEVEDASGYVKIKLFENNLYLTGVQSPTGGNSTWFIVATAPTTTDEDSTLFELKISELTNGTQVVFRLRHVKSKLYLMPHHVEGVSDAVLCAVNRDPDPDGNNLFTAIARPSS